MTNEYKPRAYQVPPEGEWREWGIWGGRGCGKTEAIARYIASEADAGKVRRVLVLAGNEAVMVHALRKVGAASRRMPRDVAGVELQWHVTDGPFVRGVTSALHARGAGYDIVWIPEARRQVHAIAEARLLARGGRVVWDCTPDPMAELLGETAPTIRSVVRRRDGSVSVTTFAVDAGLTADTKLVKLAAPTPGAG